MAQHRILMPEKKGKSTNYTARIGKKIAKGAGQTTAPIVYVLTGTCKKCPVNQEAGDRLSAADLPVRLS